VSYRRVEENMRLRKRPPTIWKKITTLTTADVCYLYGVTTMTVWNWRKKGMPYRKLSAGKFSKRHPIRFNLYKIANWLVQDLDRWPDENHLREYLKK
jgi:hypothetical protein